MSNVPKSGRNDSPFEADHNFYKLRDTITELMMNDFGVTEKRFEKKVSKYRKRHEHCPNVDELTHNFAIRYYNFLCTFTEDEYKTISDILRKISEEFTIANSIFPSNIDEIKVSDYLKRRGHLNEAIGLCYTLKQELYYVFRILPVDLNKYKRFNEMINLQIDLFKGVRKSDCKFFKNNSTN